MMHLMTQNFKEHCHCGNPKILPVTGNLRGTSGGRRATWDCFESAERVLTHCCVREDAAMKVRGVARKEHTVTCRKNSVGM